MHDKDLYEYAVIRYVPRVEREEFINVGLLMLCKRRRWLRVMVAPDYARISNFSPPHSNDEIDRQLTSFTAVACGRADAGPMAALPVEERFRWLTAVKSACLQTSRPHPGITDNLDRTFECLVQRLVL